MLDLLYVQGPRLPKNEPSKPPQLFPPPMRADDAAAAAAGPEIDVEAHYSGQAASKKRQAPAVSAATSAAAAAASSSPAPPKSATSKRARRSEDDELYTVERIIDIRCAKPESQFVRIRAAALLPDALEFRVQWKGYDDDPTEWWLPLSDFTGGGEAPMVKAFLEQRRREAFNAVQMQMLKANKQLVAALVVLEAPASADRAAAQLFFDNLSAETRSAVDGLLEARASRA